MELTLDIILAVSTVTLLSVCYRLHLKLKHSEAQSARLLKDQQALEKLRDLGEKFRNLNYAVRSERFQSSSPSLPFNTVASVQAQLLEAADRKEMVVELRKLTAQSFEAATLLRAIRSKCSTHSACKLLFEDVKFRLARGDKYENVLKFLEK